MAEGIKPIRRVVTGNDAQGRSCVLFDSAAPNVNANAFKKGTAMTDVWVFDSCPAVISGTRDDGNLPFSFEPPHNGGHLRIVQSDPKPRDYDPKNDRFLVPEHPPKKTEGGTFERGGQNHARARHAGGSAEGRRHRRAARHQPRLEQPLGPAVHHRVFVARRGGLAGKL